MNKTSAENMLHQNENFCDIDYLVDENQNSFENSLHLPDKCSPLLKAMAAHIRKNRQQEIQKMLMDESLQLQNYLITKQKNRGIKTIAFASAHKHEGVSSVVLNLTKSFEMAKTHRLLVIDGNVKSPGLTKYLGGMAPGLGLLDLLAERATIRGVLQKLNGADIYFLGHGRKRRDSSSIICYARIKRALEIFENLFDFILIDVPPLEYSPDGFIWCQAAENLVVVVNSTHTRLQSITQIKKQAEMLQIEILGTVLNKRRYAIPRFVYEWL